MRSLLLLLLFLGACSPGPPQKPIETLTVDSSTLGDAYFSNEVAADSKYKNRVLIVSGAVEEIVDKGTTLHIELESTHGIGIRCFFANRDASDRIAQVAKESLITLAGENLGLNGSFIELKGCHIH